MKRIVGTVCLGLAVVSAGALVFLVLMISDANERFGAPDPVLYMTAIHGALLLALTTGLVLVGRSLRRAV